MYNNQNTITLSGHNKVVLSVAISKDKKFILSGGKDNLLKVFRISSNYKLIRTYRGHQDWISTVLISKDRKLVLTGS